MRLVRTERIEADPRAVKIPPFAPAIRTLTQRILVFDIENKPGTYGGGDFTHGKVTAIGCKFIGDIVTASWCIQREKPSVSKSAAEAFCEYWNAADVVMGHNIRKHDISLLNGHMTTLDMPTLAEKKTIDTYHDMKKMRGLSRSLENLAARWDSPIQKIHLSEYDWERAYDGIPTAVELMKKRVTSDVLISEWLYGELLRRRLMKWQ